jgi:undecaprenyl-diphosphatase
MDAIATLDATLLRWVIGTFRSTWLDQPMIWVGTLATWGAPFLAAGVAVTLSRRDGRTLMALWRLGLAVVLASVVVVDVMKPLLHRDRPFVAHADITAVGRPSGGSAMPSGHAATAIAGAYALSLLWPGGRLLAWAVAALVLFSRMYLGVHYPTDLLVGGLAGLACAYFATAGTPARNRAPLLAAPTTA